MSQFPSEEKGGKEALNICISDAYSSPPPLCMRILPTDGKRKGGTLTKWREEKGKRGCFRPGVLQTLREQKESHEI